MVGFGMVTLRDRWERPTTAAALQLVVVQAQQIGWPVNESAVRALPFWHRDVVAGRGISAHLTPFV
jgi:hypothetical protein